ncbi:MAG: redoxin domain-containing protein [Gemmatimonadetes bacterium]|nr:redoxin domain-containing protein [Gemmatimonadota bacterium]
MKSHLPALLLAGSLAAAPALSAQPALGPKDPGPYPATDTSRVAVATQAPDFTLESLDGSPVSLSSFRGSHDVILVFYRGHW